eukprot:scaffold895_cov315-Pinguiococcus_pyrenoidosus.AAC.56
MAAAERRLQGSRSCCTMRSTASDLRKKPSFSKRTMDDVRSSVAAYRSMIIWPTSDCCVA